MQVRPARRPPPHRPANLPQISLATLRLLQDRLQAPVLAVHRYYLVVSLRWMQATLLQTWGISRQLQAQHQQQHHPAVLVDSISKPASLKKLPQRLLLCSLPVFLALHQALVPLTPSVTKDQLNPREVISSVRTKARTRDQPSPLRRSNLNLKRQRHQVFSLTLEEILPLRGRQHKQQVLHSLPLAS